MPKIGEYYFKSWVIFCLLLSRLFGGFIADIKRKAPFYLSDFTDAFHIQCLASIVYIYIAALTPIVTFGGLLSDATAGYMVSAPSAHAYIYACAGFNFPFEVVRKYCRPTFLRFCFRDFVRFVFTFTTLLSSPGCYGGNIVRCNNRGDVCPLCWATAHSYRCNWSHVGLRDNTLRFLRVRLLKTVLCGQKVQ